MTRTQYEEIEQYMLSCMADSAHDREHVYRVLYTALDIARYECGVNSDLLIAACLLHDIGRKEQFENPLLDHAEIGGQKAHIFLIQLGWPEEAASAVRDCIAAHRYRTGRPPCSTEAKILFDSDKLDVTGAMGIARTLLYRGQVSEPLYTLREDGTISDGTNDDRPSFFQEYKFKLESLYDRFFTARAEALAEERRPAAAAFYESLLREARLSCENGRQLLEETLQ